MIYIIVILIVSVIAIKLGFVPVYAIPTPTKIVLMLGGGFAEALTEAGGSAGMFKYAGGLLLFFELTYCIGTGKGLCETLALLLNEVFILWGSWGAGGALRYFSSSQSDKAMGRLATIFILYLLIIFLHDLLTKIC
jgi:hypothetical protein